MNSIDNFVKIMNQRERDIRKSLDFLKKVNFSNYWKDAILHSDAVISKRALDYIAHFATRGMTINKI